MAINNKFKCFFVALLSCFFITACEVVSLDSTGNPIIPMSADEAASFKNMEPNAVADKIWPNLLQGAKSSAITLEALTISAQNDKSYFVTLSGVVDSIDNKQNVILKIANQILIVQAGSIMRGNAIRDASTVISFDQFKNQIQFARLSKELNKKAIANTTSSGTFEVGKTIEILTALTIKNNQIQDVVPLEIIKSE
ncbi:DUF2291 family protein [Necropsobacter massiliensis]|uniref:DUF2291 family protein n=1 Tax=Necropsobacter massiliensis TaxID=1400001 RepID=UPI000595EBBB|nr:DUF2291 family protein [Necropsobacter massiliensis]